MRKLEGKEREVCVFLALLQTGEKRKKEREKTDVRESKRESKREKRESAEKKEEIRGNR